MRLAQKFVRSDAAVAASGAFDPRRIALRQLPPLAVIGVLVWFGWDRIAGLDTARIAEALAAVGPLQWLAGLVFTATSFWAVGRYDAVVHRLAGTGVGEAQAVRSGAAAIAVGQTLGLGTITGAFVRWRLLPGLGVAGALRVSVAVSLSFLAAWAVLAALALLLVPLPLPVGPVALRFGGVTVLTLATGLALCSLLRPRWLPAGLVDGLPSLRAMGAFLGLAALDTFAAGSVLWALLPENAGLAPAQVLAAYLIALGAGLILTTPGGVGPFEVALLAMLPEAGEEPLLAAILAYRALYYALPAALAGIALLRGPQSASRAAAPARRAALDPLASAPNLPFLIDAVIEGAPRAEAALLRHGALSLVWDAAGRPTAMAAATGQSLVMLSDPLRPGADGAQVIDTLGDLAAGKLLSPVLYKAGGRLAATARARGWQVAAVAQEAWLDPRDFSTAGPARSGLRRKLRKAEAAGVTITLVTPERPRPLPLDEMAEIAADWRRAHGGERGFSMGRWDAETLAWAHVLLAHDAGGRLVGFITLHANAGERTLDLMRARADAPDGLMYLLIARAIEAAGADGVARFSLAAVPAPASAAEPRIVAEARARFDAAAGGAGLRQFKSAFGPRWETLYIAAPGRGALVAGGLDLAREISQGR